MDYSREGVPMEIVGSLVASLKKGRLNGDQILVGAFAVILLAVALVAAGAIRYAEAVPAIVRDGLLIK